MSYREQAPEGFKTSGGYVTITGWKVDLYDPNNGRYVFSIGQLIEHARQNRLPEWVREVPEITARIEAVFAAERASGVDPSVRIGTSGDRIFCQDLKRGVRLERKISELKAQLATTGTLPKAFDCAKARNLLTS